MLLSDSQRIMSYETLQLTIKEMAAYITLNRPDRLNSFDMKLGHELYEVLQDVAKNHDVKAVIIKGTGKGFCGGGDVKEMYAAADKSRFLRDLTTSNSSLCHRDAEYGKTSNSRSEWRRIWRWSLPCPCM